MTGKNKKQKVKDSPYLSDKAKKIYDQDREKYIKEETEKLRKEVDTLRDDNEKFFSTAPHSVVYLNRISYLR